MPRVAQGKQAVDQRKCPHRVDSVIIGGGIAGLACARQLHRSRRDFLLIADAPGAFVDSQIAAVCITSDQRQIAQFVQRGARLRAIHTYLWNGARCVHIFHPDHVRHAAAACRLSWQLLRFRRHLHRLRTRLPSTCRQQLLQSDRWLNALVQQPACELIERHGLHELNRHFAGAMVRAMSLCDIDQLTAFDYLEALMPALSTAFVADYSQTLGRLIAGHNHRLLPGRALRIDHGERGEFVVETAHGCFRSKHLVIDLSQAGTPCLSGLLDDWLCTHRARLPYAIQVIQGVRRPEFQPGKLVLFPDDRGAVMLLPQGEYDLLVARQGFDDLDTYYTSARIVARPLQRPAATIPIAAWHTLMPAQNLYAIGDHGRVAPEDNYLTGMFAANRIIARS